MNKTIISFVAGFIIGCVATFTLLNAMFIGPLRADISAQQKQLDNAHERFKRLAERLETMENLKTEQIEDSINTQREYNRVMEQLSVEYTNMKARLTDSSPYFWYAVFISVPLVIILLMWLCSTHAADNKLIAATLLEPSQLQNWNRTNTQTVITTAQPAELPVSEKKLLENDTDNQDSYF